MLTNCPFFAAGHLQRPESFVGRDDEMTIMINLMTAAQPTSINVHGPKRIGKSSLLYHFYLTWENRVDPEKRQNFAVVYTSMAQVHTEEAFYQYLAKAWQSYTPLEKNASWQSIWAASTRLLRYIY